ncbi:hypothetical protein [Persicirhabdus sediminis]|uniref:Tetratricopeptide repeat-containing protein n=1 Tax=Persicirhabdus sediminis TaxID=454144 RepID=A0A8J7SKA6_9BACT|nr:hypothetical protein [Persicirhabdus sediminis]MBK1791924.1 hypothetical protein [Persicirhabdus sediminis]
MQTLEQNPAIWSTRKETARLLFDVGRYDEAAEIIWTAPEIPSVDLEIAFSARVLSRAKPARSIRLLKHVLDRNVKSPAKLLAIANGLMHYGMVLQAARFYGAATAADPEVVNGDLEHFMLWLDDSQKLWGDWENDHPQLDQLPWVKRDADKEENYEKIMAGLTTPITVPGLQESTAEHLINEYYRQLSSQGAEITAPPAVTVPLDRVKPEDVIQDAQRGAPSQVAKLRHPEQAIGGDASEVATSESPLKASEAAAPQRALPQQKPITAPAALTPPPAPATIPLPVAGQGQAPISSPAPATIPLQQAGAAQAAGTPVSGGKMLSQSGRILPKTELPAVAEEPPADGGNKPKFLF